MTRSNQMRWRPLFVLGGVLILAGGPFHPGGSMEQMLAHPNWVWSHLLILAGYVSFLVGLLFFRREPGMGDATARWSRLAVIGTVLQVIEMVLHTAAAVDHSNLVSGRATPVLTTHLTATGLFYPVFAITVGGLIVAAVKDQSLGSKWIAWLGIAGLSAHGVAAVLVVGLDIQPAAVLFRFVLLFALWAILAGFWPGGRELKRAREPGAVSA